MKRVLICQDLEDAPVALGPVYTDHGLEELREMAETRGWTVHGEAELTSKAQLAADKAT